MTDYQIDLIRPEHSTDYQIDLIRPVLFENSPCPPELNELILKFVRRIYDGRYKRGDLRTLPAGTYTCILRIEIKLHRVGKEDIYHEGDVDVTRVGNVFNAKFIVDGIQYEIVNSRLRANRLYGKLSYPHFNACEIELCMRQLGKPWLL